MTGADPTEVFSNISNAPGREPLFSVIIPTYNRPKQLAHCLHALGHGYSRERFEVIVVDDGSSTPVEYLNDSLPMQLLILRQPNRGPSAARNVGARRARGQYVVFLDDDCRVKPGWFKALEVAVTQHAERTMFGGRVVNSDEHNICSEVSEIFIRVILERHRARPGGLYFFRSTNMIVPREQFLEIGGFDERFRAAEDREICDRWQARDNHFQFLPDAIAVHHNELTLKAFARQHFAYGRGAWHFHRTRLSRKSSQIGFDMLAYYAHVARQVVALNRGFIGARVGLLAVWQAMNIGGFLWALLSDLRQSWTFMDKA